LFSGASTLSVNIYHNFKKVFRLLDMCLVAEQEKINIRWWDFVPPVLGLYWAPRGKQPVIGLDNSLEDKPRLLRCVMAEELGHHFTTSTKCINNVCFNYRDRLDISQVEFKALRWAALYLIPLDHLDKSIRHGVIESWELAEQFDVTEKMVKFRLSLPDFKRYCELISPTTYTDLFN